MNFSGSGFDARTWKEELLSLNAWACGLTIDESNQAFAAARQKATLERESRETEVWNAWANDMLRLKKALEESGRWSVDQTFSDAFAAGSFLSLGNNDETRCWRALAVAMFSTYSSQQAFENHSFKEYIFPGAACFDCAAFAGTTVFRDATFCGPATFFRASFSGIAYFQGATFANRASFEYATSPENSGVMFMLTKFLGGASFAGASFSGATTYQSSTFSGGCSFKGANFKRDANIFGVQFIGEVDLSDVKFEGPVVLDYSIFRRGANFASIDSEAAFSLAYVRFDQVPNFMGAVFRGKLRLDNVHMPRYPLLGWTPDKETSARFRELKRLAADAQDYDRELEFFAQEIRTSRFHRGGLSATPSRFSWRFWCGLLFSTFSWRFWFGLLYGTFSNFGRSLLRPLLFWVALLGVSAVFYLGEHVEMREARAKLNPQRPWGVATAYLVTTLDAWRSRPMCAPTDTEDLKKEYAVTDPVREALYLSLKNGLVGLDAGRAETARRMYGCLYGLAGSGDRQPKVPYEISLVSTVQTLASAVLIFLFLLAVRNLLRIK